MKNKKTKPRKRARASSLSSSRRAVPLPAPVIHTHTLPAELLQGVVGIDLIGAGGSGSQMLTGLARLHLALRSLGHEGLHVTLYDPDTVSETNIGRQLFSPSDVGYHKSTVLINRVNHFFGLKWESIPELWHTTGNDSDPAIVISCTDTRASRRDIAKGIPGSVLYWMDMGNLANTGQVVLGQPLYRDDEPEQPVHLPTIRELFPKFLSSKAKESNTPSCSLAEALRHQDLFVNQAVTTWALHLLWTFFRKGHIRHHGYFINLESGHVRPIPVPPPPAKPKTK